MPISSMANLVIFLRAPAKVQEKEVKRLCNTSTIVTVNGQFPGPTLEATTGDSFVIKVVNRVKYNVTIHWHGVRQMRNGWADGPAYVTQCPIKCGGTYTYRFDIENEEGTFFWHAHTPWLRVTVYGALIIYPKLSSSYPFPKPQKEVPIILGEWWNINYIEVAAGVEPDAYLLNGQPGDFSPCSSKETTVIPATTGETLLLRFINAALNTEFFVSIAGHTMIVVSADASYTKPFNTSYLVLGPGQTTDVLLHTNHNHGQYYIAVERYFSFTFPFPFRKYTNTAILTYDTNINSSPLLPILPSNRDRSSAFNFTSNLKNLNRVEIPKPVDENLIIVVGVQSVAKENIASMNNISFVAPRRNSILEAAYFDQGGVFTSDFPASPTMKFNQTVKGTKIYKIKYGSVVQVVLKSALLETEHPIHLHGYDFYVLGMGIGEFVMERNEGNLNMVDPPKRNTVGLPAKGWAVIRFVANNPGVWLMHCHVELHKEWGMAMGFWVENGVGEMESVKPPPTDLPPC